ncbi:MAG: peptide ABC transporter substrate-binding protein [Hyphomicrobiales bacterium]
MKPNPLLALAVALSFIVPNASAATVAPGDTLAENQDIDLWLLDDIKTLDPQKSASVGDSDAIRQLFEGLYSQAANGDLVPGVATGHEVSADGLIWTFHLRPEATWSNGDPVTAQDFVYAWRRLVDPETASEKASALTDLKVKNAKAVIDGKLPPAELGVRAIDAHTLEVTLDQPIPHGYMIASVTNTNTFPAPRAVIETYGDAWTQPGHLIGNGAYSLVEHRIGQKIVLKRNPRYRDDAHTIVKSVTFHVINEENQALTRFRAGELDVSPIPSGQYPRLKEKYPDQVYKKPRACTYAYVFNLSLKGPEALKDVRVRKGLSLAIDRSIITDNILKGGQIPAYSWTPPSMAGFKAPDIDYSHWSQAERVAKAENLLKQAGYGPDHPLKLTISYNTSEAHKKIAVAIQQFWKAIGVETRLENMEWKVFTDRLHKHEYEVGRYAICAGVDNAIDMLSFFKSTDSLNPTGFASADYDRLMNDVLTATDPNIDYDQAEHTLADKMPIAPIYFYTSNGMVKPDIRGFPVQNVLNFFYVRNMYRVVK